MEQSSSGQETNMQPGAGGRRSHRKSRAGCLQCKKRKVKCDEAKPSCRNCLKHRVSCSFAGDAATGRQPPEPLSQHQSPDIGTPSMDTAPPTSFPPGFSMLDMQLLHHYTTSTCYTLSRIPAIQAIWRDQAPHVGFSTPFVLHAILAISALHKARSDPSQHPSWMSRAQIHHETAIRAVAPVVTSLAADNSIALFLFSSLVCIFACAKPHGQTGFLVLFESGRLSEWVRLFRGTKAILKFGDLDNHRMGMLGPLFVNGAHRSATRRDPKSLEQGRPYVWELRQMIREDVSISHPDRQVYLDALDGLSRTLAVTMKPGGERRLETADVFAWLLEVSDEYLEFLRQEASIALVIFAYFCVPLRQLEYMWWMEGLSARLMAELSPLVEGKYQSWLFWPQEQIQFHSESM